jgi:hypothetical protein
MTSSLSEHTSFDDAACIPGRVGDKAAGGTETMGSVEAFLGSI